MKLYWPLIAVLVILVLLEEINANVAPKSKPQKRPKSGNRKHRGNNRGKSVEEPSSSSKGVTKKTEEQKNKKKEYLNFSLANQKIDEVIDNFRDKNGQTMFKQPMKLSKTLKKEKACHAVATLHCGCAALMDFDSGNKTKCAIREEFFKCLEEQRKPPCRHPKKVARATYRKHTEEIARVLWKTKVCLLGKDNKTSQKLSLSELNVKPDFCKKLTTGKKDRVGKRNQKNKKNKLKKNKKT